eukprot:CAMPEP_0172326560 /NCGR_PEP_ID=MMETSP1058-20130122/56911_1 /TAXON_ID=83371 /ORGANISM="Detonula confervacea, Strain CCMP 353" /LENGTH=180 /DNA_ID=CAMNT_0013043373 /DNA_START=156 /DNA_END=698 /DNA_ORIENTATION=-
MTNSKRRRQIQPGCLASLPSSSSIIPLPKTHIHRTPSELQMADEVRRAEYDDVRMYARLVVGMQSQIQRGFQTNGGVVHPLSKKSLQGVVRTKQANDDELKNLQDDVNTAGGGGWEMSYVEIEEHDDEFNYSVGSPWSTQTQLPPPSTSDSDGSLSTHGSMKSQEYQDYDECECVFSLEL